MQKKSSQNAVSLFLELAERTNKIVFTYDLDSRQFTYLNPAFEELWNKTRESVTEDPASLLETIHLEDRDYLIQAFQQMVDTAEKEDNIEFRVQLTHNKIRWMCMTAYLIEQEPGNHVISGFAEDITTMKENIGNMQRLAAKKDSVLEILAHDLAGPLNNINMVFSLVTERLKEYSDPDLDRMIRMIAKTSERSIRLIREFVKQEFLESTHAELVKNRVDLVQLIEEVVNQYKISEEEIAKTFKLYSSSEKIYVELDSYKFNQVINNLISNSIKFTHDDGVITIRVEDKKDSVLITVADNGVGIPVNRQEALFEKFTKARRPGLKGEPSVGLGMSIIKTIVEWHKGKIWFESQENKGTTFHIKLPRE
jgi:two-component system sensor histidine kinase VicK